MSTPIFDSKLEAERIASDIYDRPSIESREEFVSALAAALAPLVQELTAREEWLKRSHAANKRWQEDRWEETHTEKMAAKEERDILRERAALIRHERAAAHHPACGANLIPPLPCICNASDPMESTQEKLVPATDAAPHEFTNCLIPNRCPRVPFELASADLCHYESEIGKPCGKTEAAHEKCV